MTDSQVEYARLVADLERFLKLRRICLSMKLCRTVEHMEAIPGIRRPKSIHTTD